MPYSNVIASRWSATLNHCRCNRFRNLKQIKIKTCEKFIFNIYVYLFIFIYLPAIMIFEFFHFPSYFFQMDNSLLYYWDNFWSMWKSFAWERTGSLKQDVIDINKSSISNIYKTSQLRNTSFKIFGKLSIEVIIFKYKMTVKSWKHAIKFDTQPLCQNHNIVINAKNIKLHNLILKKHNLNNLWLTCNNARVS